LVLQKDENGVTAAALSSMLSPMLAVYGGGEGFPDFAIPCVFLQHALRMKLKSDEKIGIGVVLGLDQSVIGLRSRSGAVTSPTLKK
jgi:hypothetical protein